MGQMGAHHVLSPIGPLSPLRPINTHSGYSVSQTQEWITQRPV